MFSLEEVSLHQQNIEKIEHLDKWCRNLKILYLQNNLISKIENVSRLKKLAYLNLALNNIEKFENLEGCEDLQKLDLTANFIGELSSLKILKNNIHLEELFLVGNPCTDFEGYRQFVVATLQQLRVLDCKEVTRSERIQALQHYPELERKIDEQEQTYRLKREEEKKEAERRMLEKQKERKEKKKGQHLGSTLSPFSSFWARRHTSKPNFRKLILEDDDEDRAFWDEPVPHTPEARLEIHQYLEEKRKEKENRQQGNKEKPLQTLITPEGRVLNVNEAKYASLGFREQRRAKLNDLLPFSSRHLDISFLNVDVQPTYVRVMVKEKAFQLVLPEEVKPDSSIAKRSQTTGHLVINMPKQQAHPTIRPPPQEESLTTLSQERPSLGIKGLEKLEVDPTRYSFPDVTNIVHKKDQVGQGPLRLHQPKAVDAENLNFEDNPEVPPLI
uniref:Leucine-rich repeat-containing protein 6 n=1 Tax=Naja naja TaxID=35670 RepID=A0A8C7E713_NAJNA